MPVPGPTQRQLHAVDSVLTGRLIARQNADEDFIADRAFPPISQPGEPTGTYYRIQEGMRSAGNLNIAWAIGASTPTVGFTPSTATWRCDLFGAKVPLPRASRSASQITRIDLVCQSRGYAEVNIARDVRMAAGMFVTGVWAAGNEVTLGAALQWDDAGGVPISDIETGIRVVKLACGKRPDTMVLGYDSARVLRANGDITNLLPAAQATSHVSDEALIGLLKAHFKFKRVFIGEATRNTANEGATETPAFVWTDNCWLGFCGEDGQGDGELPACGQIASTEGGAPTIVEKWYDDDRATDYVRVSEERGIVLFDTSAGYLIINCAN